MSITLKPEAYFKHFEKLHATKPVSIDVLNVANPDALPAPLIVSKRDSTNPNVNKLIVGIFNQGIERLVVGGPNLTGIYINFSDLMSVTDMRRIKVSIEGTPVHTELSRRKDTPVEITFDELTSEDRDPTIPPPPNNQHLGTEPVLYIWPEKEIEIRPQETLMITLANVVSDFRPALRYLNVSWDMNRKGLNNLTQQEDSILEGLQQVSIQLLRPADYAEPPFPLVAHWLNNNNLIYTAEDDTSTLKNTLDFAISNIGLQDFKLDCNKHSRGVPYFELVMVGKKPGDTGDFSTAVADTTDLVLAQIPDTTKNEELNQLWRVNKRIQGPIVKWEIRPDMNFNPGADDDEEKNLHHKTLLGTDRNATITFRISELRSKLDDGVALVYFRFYNMPDHDDGQLVLFLEKRRVSTGGNMIAQLDKYENEVASPLKWRQEKILAGDQEVPTTTVTIGDTIETEVSEDDGSTTTKTNRLPLQLKVQGNTAIHGDVSVVNVGDVNSKTFQTESRRGTLKVVGTEKGSDMWRVAAIHAEGDSPASGVPMNAATRMVFATRKTDGAMSDKMVLSADGKLGIGGSLLPKERLHITAGNILLDRGEIHATESLILKTGTFGGIVESAGLTLNQKGTNTLVIADNGDTNFHGSLTVQGGTDFTGGLKSAGGANLDGKLEVTGDSKLDGKLEVTGEVEIGSSIQMTETETYIYPKKGKFVRLGKGNSAIQDIFCRFTYFGDSRAVSDRASKQDIRPLAESIDAATLLDQLQPVSYRRKDNPDIDLTTGCDEQATRYGFIANDVQKVLPDAVDTVGETDTLCLDYQALNTVLFQAVKDQEAKLAALQTEMAELRKLLGSRQEIGTRN